ncbi:MAG: YgjP-like metallopeptidase domain-containing protein [Burkholderiaceae bacterium]
MSSRSRPLRGTVPGQLTLPFADPTPIGIGAQTAGRPEGGSSRFTLLDGQRIDFRLRRTKRRTIGFLIDERGLTVSVPRWLTLSELEIALQEKARWILRKLVEWRDYERRRDSLAIRWENGATLRYLGRSLVMRIDERARGIDFLDDELRIGLPPKAGADQLKNRPRVGCRAKPNESRRSNLQVLAERLGQAPSRWGLSSARTRCCSADGVIRPNWRLIHFPLEIIDYDRARDRAPGV